MVSDPDDPNLCPRGRAARHRIESTPSLWELEAEEVGQNAKRLRHAAPRNPVAKERGLAQALRVLPQLLPLRRPGRMELPFVNDDFRLDQASALP